MQKFKEDTCDVVVIGAGHAGAESALASARLNLKTILLTLNLDGIAFMACNPSIGGTGKAHLVREIDALGGEMAKNADKTRISARMLNGGKGEAVQSLRFQCDKNAYHREMKRTLENTENLKILQAEAEDIICEDGKVSAVLTTYGGIIYCKAVIVAAGVYLNAETVTGEVRQKSGPAGFAPANKLTDCLVRLGFKVRRFKTGTPARLDSRTIDFDKLEEQDGEPLPPFSYISESNGASLRKCYLAYTNAETHEIILNNLERSPIYNGDILSTGPRYCPSIETKVVRFADKERHQLFLEPEGLDTCEIYVQGASTSLPHDVQKKMYRSINGLNNAEIMRYAYAIEYDCIDPLDIYPTLEFKKVKGLYTAGQINGTSGYEEAAAQGLIAGINAAFSILGKPPLIIGRSEGYIGVLIDDLTTKGCEEPYRMMTSRAEYRISLRQDNADFRLTPKIFDCALYTPERKKAYEAHLNDYAAAKRKLDEKAKSNPFDATNAHTYADFIRRGVKIEDICEKFGILGDIPLETKKSVEADIKYEGYLKKNAQAIERAKKAENKKIPEDIDYEKIIGLRLEAREKLKRVRPVTLGQASRISGVNPADIAVLIVWLSSQNKN